MEAESEITALQARVTALEWALHHLLLVLEAEDSDPPRRALTQALYTAAERAAIHKRLSGEGCQALLRLTDELAGTPAELPQYLKQLRRDWPPSEPDTHEPG